MIFRCNLSFFQRIFFSWNLFNHPFSDHVVVKNRFHSLTRIRNYIVLMLIWQLISKYNFKSCLQLGYFWLYWALLWVIRAFRKSFRVENTRLGQIWSNIYWKKNCNLGLTRGVSFWNKNFLSKIMKKKFIPRPWMNELTRPLAFSIVWIDRHISDPAKFPGTTSWGLDRVPEIFTFKKSPQDKSAIFETKSNFSDKL